MNILVCATKQDTVKRLIEKGIELKDTIDGTLFVLHVTQKEITNFAHEVQFLYDTCKGYNANFGVVHSDSIIKAITDYIKANHIQKVILGETRQTNPAESTMANLQSALSDIAEIVIVPIKEEIMYKDII